MRYLSLYSGIGMHDLGFERAGWTCVGQVEIDAFCRAVLEKHWPGLPRWSDVRDVRADDVVDRCGPIDLITGGFACQDISVAGRGAGLTKFSRSGITFRNLFRLARSLRPAWLVIENVAALRTRGIDRVLGVVERLGYAASTLVVGAGNVGAPHRRQRVWIVCRMADADNARLEGAWSRTGRAESEIAMSSGRSRARWPAGPRHAQHEWEQPRLAHAQGDRWPVEGQRAEAGHADRSRELRRDEKADWVAESPLGRAAARDAARLDGFARRSALKAYGNGNPPDVAELIARTINRAREATPC